ncbi:MAG: molecular chaperone DnaK, partial [Verrucomicrobiota bacterium]|nr:molecular chaperone DnaK [Verrucomicrobiota bacterium]
TLTATRKGLADCANEMDADYKNKVEAALKNVEEILSLENPKTKTGDPKKLKEVNAALDEVTKPLADLMMDKVMETMLRQRGILRPDGN